MSALGPEPGWYLDVDDPSLERFWNGESWTEHRRTRRLSALDVDDYGAASQTAAEVNEGQPETNDITRQFQVLDWVEVDRPGSRSHGRVGQVDSLVDGSERIRLRFRSDAKIYVFAREDLVAAGQPADCSASSSRESRSTTRRDPTPSPKGKKRHTEATQQVRKQPEAPKSSQTEPSLARRTPVAAGRPSASAFQSWLDGVREFGPDRVERGTSCWNVGVAIIAVACALFLSAFWEWGRMTTRTLITTLSGIGSISAHVTGTSQSESVLVGRYAIGTGALVLGVIGALAGAGFLWSRWRTASAVSAVVAGAISLIVSITSAMNIREWMLSVTGPVAGSYTVGVGLVFACVISAALTGLGATAFLLERRSSESVAGGRL